MLFFLYLLSASSLNEKPGDGPAFSDLHIQFSGWSGARTPREFAGGVRVLWFWGLDGFSVRDFAVVDRTQIRG